jgi:hypothetical protein
MKPSFTIGIEEEYQTIDPATYDLRSHIAAQIIDKGRRRLDERVKQGQRLYYDRDGRRVRIRRIYNRVIPDELDRGGLRARGTP